MTPIRPVMMTFFVILVMGGDNGPLAQTNQAKYAHGCVVFY